MNAQSTPFSSTTSKKRELSSPEFCIDSKKNKHGSLSSESELNVSEIPDSTPTDTSTITDMASSQTGQQTAQPAQLTSPHITIPSSEMLKLSDMLKDTFRGEIVNLVDSVVTGVLSGLSDRIASLEEKNLNLERENRSLRARVTSLEKAADQAEQYSRRNCLRITGIQEDPGEDTDEIVLKMAADLGADIQINDIDRSHRVGKRRSDRVKPREMIVKFATFRTRQKLYKLRTSLKNKGYNGVFLNEDLTKTRSKVLYDARQIVKSEQAKGVWTSDGVILIKDHTEIVHRVTTVSELAAIEFPPKPDNEQGGAETE